MSHNDRAPGVAEPSASALHPGGEPDLDTLFRIALEHNASALHLKPGRPAMIRVAGSSRPLDYPTPLPDDMERFLLPLLTPRQRTVLAEEGGVSFSHVVGPEGARFQVTVFRQRGELSLVARRVNSVIPTVKELGLPDVVETWLDLPAGLIVVAGTPGAGKRATVAAMLDHINARKRLHILTIEDRIAYDLIDKEAWVEQREAGVDFRDRREAVEAAVRQEPDVLSVGELRDAESVDAALRVAERGRLVFGTVNAPDVPSAIGQLLDLFSLERRGAVRKGLADNLRAVVAQRLMKGRKKERVLVHEILLVNPTVRKLIEAGEDRKLPDAIRLFFQEGMIEFTEHLRILIDRGEIDRATALEWAPNPDRLKMALKGIRLAAPGIIGDEPPAPPPPPAPVRSPAAAAAAGPTPATRAPAPIVRRKATVRYFTRMHPNYLYRLLVVLSGQEIRKLLKNEVGQATSDGFTVRVHEPIEVEPMLPGCSVYPPRREVVVGGDAPVEARFQVLAHTQGGALEDPCVVLRQGGKELARVALTVRVGKPTLAYGLAALSVAVPMLLKYLKLDPDAQAGAEFSGYFQLVNSVLSLPWWMWTAPLLCAAGVALWWCWPREDVFWNVELDPPEKRG